MRAKPEIVVQKRQNRVVEPKYGIADGQIYVAADGSLAGHLVVDAHTYADVGDVVVKPFNKDGFYENRRIDSFKLAQVRYTLSEYRPSWVPMGI